MILVAPDALKAYALGVFEAMGAPRDIAAETARHLVLSNLAGHDSHGVLRIPTYVEMADTGALMPSARPEVIREGPTSVLVDANRCFGHHSTRVAVDLCMAKAAEAGVAIGSVRHSTHTGRMGTYSELAAERGFVCIATTGSSGPEYGLVAPFGGAGRLLSTNPWTVGIPAGPGRKAFVYDAATSTIAEGKAKLAQWKGIAVPEGTVLDREGAPSTDPSTLERGGTLTPLGAPQAGHKGYGFSLAAALLGGLSMIGDTEPSPAGMQAGFTGIGGVFMVVFGASLFGDPSTYQEMVAVALDHAKATRPAPGVSEVLYAGEPEERSRQDRLRSGIPIPGHLWDEFGRIAARFGLPRPAAD